MYRVNEATTVAIDGASGVDLEAGNADTSFRDFFLENEPRLRQALRWMVGRVDEAEELTQEAFLKVWERWGRVREMERPDGYLFRTALNLARQRRRAAMRAAKRLLMSDTRHRDDIEMVDAEDAAVRLLQRTTPRRRAALILIDVYGMPAAEAAPLLGVQAGAVRTLVARGRADIDRAIADGRRRGRDEG